MDGSEPDTQKKVQQKKIEGSTINNKKEQAPYKIRFSSPDFEILEENKNFESPPAVEEFSITDNKKIPYDSFNFSFEKKRSPARQRGTKLVTEYCDGTNLERLKNYIFRNYIKKSYHTDPDFPEIWDSIQIKNKTKNYLGWINLNSVDLYETNNNSWQGPKLPTNFDFVFVLLHNSLILKKEEENYNFEGFESSIEGFKPIIVKINSMVPFYTDNRIIGFYPYYNSSLEDDILLARNFKKILLLKILAKKLGTYSKSSKATTEQIINFFFGLESVSVIGSQLESWIHIIEQNEKLLDCILVRRRDKCHRAYIAIKLEKCWKLKIGGNSLSNDYNSLVEILENFISIKYEIILVGNIMELFKQFKLKAKGGCINCHEIIPHSGSIRPELVIIPFAEDKIGQLLILSQEFNEETGKTWVVKHAKEIRPSEPGSSILLDKSKSLKIYMLFLAETRTNFKILTSEKCNIRNRSIQRGKRILSDLFDQFLYDSRSREKNYLLGSMCSWYHKESLRRIDLIQNTSDFIIRTPVNFVEKDLECGEVTFSVKLQ